MQITPRTLQSTAELDQQITQPPTKVVEAIAGCPGDFVVLGAGGKMGFHIARMLQRSLAELGRQQTLTVVSRFSSSSARHSFQQLGFQVIPADLSLQADLDRLPLAENVIFLAGVKFGTASDPGQLQRLNVTMPAMVAEKYRQSRIVALSTGCVYSFTTPQSGGSKESSPTNPPGQYARSCLGREQAFFRGSEKHGTPCALVRLNYSIDLRYGVLVDLAQDVLAGRPVDLSTGYVNVIWQGDAVAYILQCFSQLDSPPRVLNVTGAETLSVRQIASQFAERFGCQVSFTGRESESAWLSNSARAHQLFGVPRISVSQMMDWIADWLKRGNPTLNKPTQFQNREGSY
ncbi:MAG: NAD(P)-dependent oxidoreductase [Pirellulales bacterium]|nr:NAD(P)-dependent oxidoreductase [Pirellulales bacterium]